MFAAKSEIPSLTLIMKVEDINDLNECTHTHPHIHTRTHTHTHTNTNTHTQQIHTRNPYAHPHTCTQAETLQKTTRTSANVPIAVRDDRRALHRAAGLRRVLPLRLPVPTSAHLPAGADAARLVEQQQRSRTAQTADGLRLPPAEQVVSRSGDRHHLLSAQRKGMSDREEELKLLCR